MAWVTDGPRMHSATKVLRAIRERRIGVKELVSLYIDRIERYDGARGLNAVAELNPDVIEQAERMDAGYMDSERPLFGLPILVKDNIDVSGMHTTAGSLALKGNLADRDAPVIANLRKNGAIILGKTHMTEFANYTTQGMPNGYSSGGGQVKNAYDALADPSGSSSGSAVAVSAALCAASIGTDTSFSIVACATNNGVVGLKPPHGALPSEGIIPISHTLDSAGPMADTFTDALLVYQGMRDEGGLDIAPAAAGDLHLAVNTYNRDRVSQDQWARYEALFRDLRGAGAKMSEVYHPYAPEMKDIMRCEFKHDLEAYLAKTTASAKSLAEIIAFYEAHPEAMKYGISYLQDAWTQASGRLDDAPYLHAVFERGRMREAMLQNMITYDACVMTGPTNIMHFTGLASLALKLCMGDDGMPRGIILYGADEARLYRAALTIERYCRPVYAPNMQKWEAL